jgi:ATP-dependent RNA helicase DHX29
MADSPLPEMMRLSLSDLALRIKIMKVKLGSTIEDVLARALDPPISINVQRAVSMLVEVSSRGRHEQELISLMLTIRSVH